MKNLVGKLEKVLLRSYKTENTPYFVTKPIPKRNCIKLKIKGFVVIWWPRHRINENMSQVVDSNTFKCVIELIEEDTEYEIMVVPETSARNAVFKFS